MSSCFINDFPEEKTTLRGIDNCQILFLTLLEMFPRHHYHDNHHRYQTSVCVITAPHYTGISQSSTGVLQTSYSYCYLCYCYCYSFCYNSYLKDSQCWSTSCCVSVNKMLTFSVNLSFSFSVFQIQYQCIQMERKSSAVKVPAVLLRDLPSRLPTQGTSRFGKMSKPKSWVWKNNPKVW